MENLKLQNILSEPNNNVSNTTYVLKQYWIQRQAMFT